MKRVEVRYKKSKKVHFSLGGFEGVLDEEVPIRVPESIIPQLKKEFGGDILVEEKIPKSKEEPEKIK